MSICMKNLMVMSMLIRKMERCMGIQHMENSTHMSMDIIIQIPRQFLTGWQEPLVIWRQ